MKVYYIHYNQVDAVSQWLLDNNVKQAQNPMQFTSGIATAVVSRLGRTNRRVWTKDKNSKPSGYYVSIEDPDLMAMFVLAFSEYVVAYEL